MGCDIHGFWEFKTPDGKWIAFEPINDTRSYEWFRIIADVRGVRGSHTAHRGVPDDCSLVWGYLTNSWGADMHSHTWLSAEEVRRANQELYAAHMVDDGNQVPEDLSLADHYHETIPSHDMEISRIYLPGPEGSYKTMAWAGTLAENIGKSDITDYLRIVIGFDN